MTKSANSWSNREKYELFMGRWSRQIGSKFLSWIEEDHNITHKTWIDLGCGTGVLSHLLLEQTNANYVLGIDPASDFLPISDLPVMEFKIGTSDLLETLDSEFDFVVSGLAFNFMSDLNASLTAMCSVLKDQGVLALYVWDYPLKMEFLRYFWDAVVRHDKNAISLDEGVKFSFCNLEELENLFKRQNLQHIRTKMIDIPTYFESFADYWEPFLGGQGPAGAYIHSCSDQQLDKIKLTLQETLPTDETGGITLIARALAVQGTLK